MDYEKLANNETQFLSLTTLLPLEFEFILDEFRPLWYKYFKIYTLEGKRRKKKNWYPEKDTPTLPTVADKLLFILMYFKQHPLQQFQAASFNLSQAKVSVWVKILTPILLETLKKLKCVPCRDGAVLKDFLQKNDDI